MFSNLSDDAITLHHRIVPYHATSYYTILHYTVLSHITPYHATPYVQVQYKDRSTVSTRPTPKGLLAINPFSEMFGIQHLDRKPLKELYQGELREEGSGGGRKGKGWVEEGRTE